MKSRSILLLSGLLALSIWAPVCAAGERGGAEPADAPGGLVVHEWGVVELGTGSNGSSPLIGASEFRLSGMPEFVHHNKVLAPDKFQIQQEMIVRKPVIHFYGVEGQKMKVKLMVKRGVPVVYYPKPALTMHSVLTVNNEGELGTHTYARELTWDFTLTKTPPADLAEPPAGHWWHATRRIPSDYVLMDEGTEKERFVFYEATAEVGPELQAEVTGEGITLKNVGTGLSGPAVLIVNDCGNRIGFYSEPIAAGERVELSRDDLPAWDDETLLENCRRQWIETGMTAGEADGIVESWRPELLGQQGFLLISKLPDKTYNRILPIEINPAPAELTRVCLIFDRLAGQDERIRWLPELEKKGNEGIARLGETGFKERMQARADLVAMGEVISPLVKKVAGSDEVDIQTKMAAATLLGALTESPVCDGNAVARPNGMGGLVPMPAKVIPLPGVEGLPVDRFRGGGKLLAPE